MTLPITKNKHKIKSQTAYKISVSATEKSMGGYTRMQFIQKRAIDFIVGGILLLLSLPIALYTIIRIKKESPGPIFFKQSRIGRNGKPFMCYKFRSMHVNTPSSSTKTGDERYTQDNDSRIFPFGNTMRKMRIDELPQLLNIFKGEMHLLGPRAEWDILVKDYEKIIPNYHERHNVAPGITGLAQVCYPYGRNSKDAKRKLKYDTFYINKWSLRKELIVIVKTIGVVLGKKGL